MRGRKARPVLILLGMAIAGAGSAEAQSLGERIGGALDRSAQAVGRAAERAGAATGAAAHRGLRWTRRKVRGEDSGVRENRRSGERRG